MKYNFNVDKFREEVNILTSSLDEKVGNNKERILAAQEAYKFLITLSNYRHSFKKLVFDTFNEFFSTGLLSPLTLEDTEFDSYNFNNELRHKRCDRILKNDNGICDNEACVFDIKHVYDCASMEEIEFDDYATDFSYPIPRRDNIVVTRGGVFTNLIVNRFYLTNDVSLYTPKEPLELPVSIVMDGDKAYYCVDAREPVLRTLNDLYITTYKIDNDLKSKYDIRKFKKLNKCTK